MRITRAYTITPEVKRILDTKLNKSDYVCRAVRKLHTQELDFELRDVPTRQMIAALSSRDDLPYMIKMAVIGYLQEKL